MIHPLIEVLPYHCIPFQRIIHLLELVKKTKGLEGEVLKWAFDNWGKVKDLKGKQLKVLTN